MLKIQTQFQSPYEFTNDNISDISKRYNVNDDDKKKMNQHLLIMLPKERSETFGVASMLFALDFPLCDDASVISRECVARASSCAFVRREILLQRFRV